MDAIGESRKEMIDVNDPQRFAKRNAERRDRKEFDYAALTLKIAGIGKENGSQLLASSRESAIKIKGAQDELVKMYVHAYQPAEIRCRNLDEMRRYPGDKSYTWTDNQVYEFKGKIFKQVPPDFARDLSQKDVYEDALDEAAEFGFDQDRLITEKYVAPIMQDINSGSTIDALARLEEAHRIGLGEKLKEITKLLKQAHLDIYQKDAESRGSRPIASLQEVVESTRYPKHDRETAKRILALAE